MYEFQELKTKNEVVINKSMRVWYLFFIFIKNKALATLTL